MSASSPSTLSPLRLCVVSRNASAPSQAALHPPAAAWLREFAVSRSRVCAHTDPAGTMPADRGDWSAWNVRSAAPVTPTQAAEHKVCVCVLVCVWPCVRVVELHYMYRLPDLLGIRWDERACIHTCG